MTEDKKKLVSELSKVLLEHGNVELGGRVLSFVDLNQMNVISKMEELITDLKSNTIKASKAEKDIIKHVYRKLTS